MASSGGLSCPDAETRLAYYSATSLPTLVWGGNTQWSGAGPTDATGLPYRSTILGLLAEPSSFKLTVNSVDFTPPTGSIDLDIEVMEGGIDVSNMFLRMAVTEDDVSYGGDVYYDVTRDMIDDVPITVSNLGEVQNVNRTFPVDPLWVEANLEAIAFLQDDTDKKVHAAASSEPNPDYSLRYYALGELQHVGPSSGDYTFENFAVYNLGNLTDSFTVDLTGDLPAGWFAGICDDTVCFGSTLTLELAPGGFKELHLLVSPTSPGYASLALEMSQAMVVHDFPRALKYNYITDDVDVLVVDDDGADLYENYLIDALSVSGYTFGVWDRLTTGPDATTLNNFPGVIWSVGFQFPTLDADDRAALSSYLNAGGALFITGQDIGYDLNDQGGAAYQWYRDYLHANYIADDTNDYTLSGVPGDPVSDGIDLVIQGGDGANNQDYPDDIDPADASATVIWTYDAARNGAVRADTGTYKVVYLSFGFEAIDNATDRRAVIQQSMDWLLLPPAPAGWVPTDTPLLLAKGAGTRLRLSWGVSCLASDVNYNIYQGTLGDFEGHEIKVCGTGGMTTKLISPDAGDKYYLVVPAGPYLEGSYGRSSVGERPQGTSVCLPQLIGECD
jgi:hypothetical protein